jgi:adenylate kinase
VSAIGYLQTKRQSYQFKGGKMKNIILIGAQASGKGTQAELLTQELGIPHISSGDLFREEIGKHTALGLQVQTSLDHGDLVPDEITVRLVLQRLQQPDCAKGSLLDGFPRTLAQAQALDEGLARDEGTQVTSVIYLHVPREALVQRLAGRYICELHQHVYNIQTHPPKTPGICDLDGSKLFQRSDDTGEAVEHRLDIFFHQTIHLLNYYRSQGKLLEIDGNQSIEAVHQDVLRAIKQQAICLSTAS